MGGLTTRILSSIGFVVLIIGPIFLDARIAFVVYGILGLFSLLELFKLLEKSGNAPTKAVGVINYVVLVFASYDLFFLDIAKDRLWLLWMLGVLLIASGIEVFRTNAKPIESVLSAVFSPVFISLSFLGIGYFLSYRSDLPNLWITISLFALIWINDSGAYLIGRQLGKTKLFERVSPNKTWEGTIAGLICTLIASYLFGMIEGMPSWPVMLGFGFFCVISGSLGDLLESRLKRSVDIKDSGKFLPGHGGFLDRFDAMMLAIPTSILYFELVLPKA